MSNSPNRTSQSPSRHVHTQAAQPSLSPSESCRHVHTQAAQPSLSPSECEVPDLQLGSETLAPLRQKADRKEDYAPTRRKKGNDKGQNNQHRQRTQGQSMNNTDGCPESGRAYTKGAPPSGAANSSPTNARTCRSEAQEAPGQDSAQQDGVPSPLHAATPSPQMPPATPSPYLPPATPSPHLPPATPSPLLPPATPSPLLPPASPSPQRPPATPSPQPPRGIFLQARASSPRGHAAPAKAKEEGRATGGPCLYNTAEFPPITAAAAAAAGRGEGSGKARPHPTDTPQGRATSGRGRQWTEMEAVLSPPGRIETAPERTDWPNPRRGKERQGASTATPFLQRREVADRTKDERMAKEREAERGRRAAMKRAAAEARRIPPPSAAMVQEPVVPLVLPRRPERAFGREMEEAGQGRVGGESGLARGVMDPRRKRRERRAVLKTAVREERKREEERAQAAKQQRRESPPLLAV
uniref:Uncharacterized protein n=1 Tax=Chromera velia CCMP2878 TaxID=1169474 RepID=A0A0G4FHZ9_9ALVE|eukprot:Cvel_17096.t1-p1 / transcript=Cvel_17096.t1 / gene=Cvel_17096 / organism=Chromera_velia_CCMP2878 / gene_product=hypothetical protein / transcript_product=hypothetical protein / location=Cvel_scaffold1348:17758-19161(+) / protein_length=468 / sequence_SO=supercontig / SO=protein_coding / is_pseudo=false